tara:strand:+ start:407 stop:1207 length:801 start_codon:yes stop_codon:yes gene_type:complete
MEGLISIREQAREIATANSSGDMQEVDVMRELLREVKNWTQVLLDEECRRVSQTIPYLQKLLTALFVMKVKVLSVINMRRDTEEFPLTIPSNATFIHHVYINCSNVILDNQSVLDTFTVMELSPLVQVGIRNACFACVDWSALLAWGLDGVNVNDVVTSVMQSEQSEQKSEEPEASAASDFDAENDAAESDDFESMANADKVREEDATEEPSLFSDDDKVPTDENADESASDPDRNESTTDPDDGPSDNSNEESKTITNGEEPSFF